MMIVECMHCRSRLRAKSSEGGRNTVTGGICEDCLDLHYPRYAERVRAMRSWEVRQAA